jgi:sugar/nucleoside kinase (ribokinase family)
MSQTAPKLITGMGAALVDLFADIDDAGLQALGSPKASMSLIDTERSVAMRENLHVHTQRAGGSAANTIAGLAALGQETGFIGKIGDDALGALFSDSMTDLGVRFPVTPLDAEAHPTGHCLVLVTPDAERTMHTVLGASVTTAPEDLNNDLLAQTGLIFAEGYIWDAEPGRAAFTQAARQVRAQGGQAAFSLADAYCVDRHRAAFHRLLTEDIDIVLANLAEAHALFETDNFDEVIAGMRGLGLLGVVTMSAEGAMVIDHDTVERVPAVAVDDVQDLTGAGDQFAAGFFAGLVNGQTPAQAAGIGVVMASEVIRHFGPRPQSDLAALMQRHGLSL